MQTKVEVTCRIWSSVEQKPEPQSMRSIRYYCFFQGKKLWLKDAAEALFFKSQGIKVWRSILIVEEV